MGIKRVNILNLFFEDIYVKLNKNTINLINDRIIEKYGSTNNYPDKNLLDYIYRIRLGKKSSLRVLSKLINDLDLNKDMIQKGIILITSNKNTNIGIKNPKLPFNFYNEETSRFISSILGDGNLNNSLIVDYNNQVKKLINLILKTAQNIFGDVDHKLYLKKNTYILRFPRVIGILLFHLGLKPGYKVETNQKIPSFILSSNKQIKVSFLRQFYNDEGNVRLKDRRLQIKQTLKLNKMVDKLTIRKDPDKYAPNILKDIKSLLSSFIISSKISLSSYRFTNKGVKTDWELSTYGKENLEKFQKLINFDLFYKSKLLEQSIKSYKFPSAPRNGRLQFALEKTKEIQRKYGFINKILLAKEAKRSVKVATYYLVDLKKKGIIKVIEKPRNRLGFPMPMKYKLV